MRRETNAMHNPLKLLALIALLAGGSPWALAHGGDAGATLAGGLLEAETYTAADQACDPTGDREHTQAEPDGTASGGRRLFLPEGGCGVLFEDVAFAQPWTRFDHLAFRLGGRDGDLAAAVRVLVGGQLAAEASLDRAGAAPGWGLAAFATSHAIEAGTHDVRLEFTAAGGSPGWMNLFVDYLATDHAAPPMPPAAPSLAAETGPGRGMVTLRWTVGDHGAPLTAVRVYRGEAPGALALHREVSPSGSFVDTGLPNGAVRWYAVRAVNRGGEGPASAEVRAQAPDLASEPRNVRAEPGSYGQIRVAWDPPASTGGVPLFHYVLYRGTDPQRMERVATTTGLAATDEVARLGTNLATTIQGAPNLLDVYHYRVAAVNVVGGGPRSEAACSAPGPWTLGLQPALGEPCPAGPGTASHVLLDQAVAAPGAGTPGVEADLLRVEAGPDAGAETYTLALAAAGEALPAVTVFTGGAPAPAVQAALLRLDPVALPDGAAVRVEVELRSRPVATTCLLAVGGACVAEGPHPLRAADLAPALLVVRATVHGPDGAVLAAQALAVPFAGQAGALGG